MVVILFIFFGILRWPTICLFISGYNSTELIAKFFLLINCESEIRMFFQGILKESVIQNQLIFWHIAIPAGKFIQYTQSGAKIGLIGILF